MRAITKGKEPKSLVNHRSSAHSNFDNYAGKDELREVLVRDQRGLCCYCMTRIKATGTAMKIEHWRCQSRNASLELSYSNLLAACHGGHGQPEDKQHCDTKKGDRDLKFNPADASHGIEQLISFEMDGTITSSDTEFAAQLNDVLNLNLPLLKKRRKEALTGFLKWWNDETARLKGPVPKERLKRERARRLGDGSGQLAPYDPVVVYWINQRLKRA